MIRSVMFDFGGVLTTSPFEWFERYEREQGLPPGTIRRLNATDPEANAWARLERNEIDFAQFCEEFEAEARRAGHTLDGRAATAGLYGALRPEMVAVVRDCARRFLTACLTNNFHAARIDAAELQRADVAEVLALFDLVVESRAVGIRKPDPRFYLLACERLGVAPSEVVYLDDLGINLKPARQLGMTTIKVAEPARAIAELYATIGGAPPEPAG